VRPGLRPQPVRYSIQFGPPSAVPVYLCVSNYSSLLYRFPYLILDDLIIQQLIFGEREIKVVADKTRVLLSSCALHVCVRVSES
jgi:hypothetical protein